MTIVTMIIIVFVGDVTGSTQPPISVLLQSMRTFKIRKQNNFVEEAKLVRCINVTVLGTPEPATIIRNYQKGIS